MAEKYISVDLNDPRTGEIADVISNKTSKRILTLLAESEMSEGEIAKSLDLPANTVEYNIKKLVNSGLIEKSKGTLWSVKGRKIEKYRVSNKKIVISPKSLARGVLPALIFVLLATLVLSFINIDSASVSRGADDNLAVGNGDSAAGGIAESGGQDVAAVTSGAANVEVDDGIGRGLEIIPPETYPEKDYDNASIEGDDNEWAWYLLGALSALLVVVLWNLWRERK